MNLRIALAVGIMSGFMGCASITSFQDARTCEKGTGRVHLAYNAYKEDYGDRYSINSGMIQLGGRYGLTDKFDLGITYVIPGSVVLDGKYMFTSRESVTGLSSGLKLGYLEYSINDDTTAALDAILPVYFSLYPLSWVAFTLNPDVVGRFPIKGMSKDPIILVGGNASLRLGKNTGIIAEAGYHMQPGEERTFLTYGGALYTPLKLDGFLGMFGL